MDNATPHYATLTVDAGIARLTLDRPEVHNAFDDRLIGELNNHLARLRPLAEANEVRVMVLASRGKSFSAGADLNWMKRMVEYDHDANLEDSRQLAELMHRLDSLPCPTLCRVQGAAFGGAVGLAACCDIVIASQRATLCLSEVRIGLSPAVISPYVQRALGPRQMRRYALTGEVMDADTALSLGLVHQVVPHAELDNALDTMLATLTNGSPQAQRATKALLADVEHSTEATALREQTCEVIAALRVSPEGQAGLESFFAKRAPDWTSLPSSSASERPS